MKKLNIYFLIILCFLTIFCICEKVSALDVGTNYSQVSGLGTEDIRFTIASLINTSLGLLGIVFIVILIISGTYYFFNKTDAEKANKAKKIIISAVIGLVIILSGYTIVNYIINAIINPQQGDGGQDTNTITDMDTNTDNNNINNTDTNTDGGLPIIFECVGNIPNAILCEGTDLDLSASTPKILLPECLYEKKCEYTCLPGLNYINGACYGCTGEDPANTIKCPYTEYDITTLISKVAVTSCHPATKCEFRCNNNFILSNGICLPNPYKCTGSIPENSTICYNDNINLTIDTEITPVRTCTVKRCEYKCNSNYIPSGKTCISNPYKCLPENDIFTNASLCPQANIDLIEDTDKILIQGKCTGIKCSYACNLGYENINNKCEPYKYAIITVDNDYELYINGALVGEDSSWYQTETYNIETSLITGQNIIAIKAVDWGGGYGVIAKFGKGDQVYTGTGDAGWKCLNLGKTNPAPAGWETIGYNDSAWQAAVTPSPGTIGWGIDIPGAQWIWTSDTATGNTILCRYHLTL